MGLYMSGMVWCCGLSEGLCAEGALVGDALRELPAARSRDSSPRPIIDRSPEKRWTRRVPPLCRLLLTSPRLRNPTTHPSLTAHINSRGCHCLSLTTSLRQDTLV